MADTSLLPVVVGGLLALGGTVAGVIGTAIRDAVQQRHEAKKRRADKFEELVAAVYEFDHWLDGARQGRDAPETASPFAKVQSISAVYFPVFSKLVRELDDAADQCIVAIYEARNSNPYTRQVTEEPSQANIAYVDKRNALLDLLKEFAHKAFKSRDEVWTLGLPPVPGPRPHGTKRHDRR